MVGEGGLHPSHGSSQYCLAIFTVYFNRVKMKNMTSVCSTMFTGEGAPYGVEINAGGIVDTYASFIWEPAVVKVLIQLSLHL
jgi:hypothetical protein